MSLKSILAHSALYSLFQDCIGASKFRKLLAESYVRGKSGDRVLDIGCGTGNILEHLKGLDYHGFDMNAVYIERARKKYGKAGQFTCGNVVTADIEPKSFDVVLASGILHHLSDEETQSLFRLAASVLKPGGRLVTLDGCYAQNQSRIARYLISKDRGEYMRNQEEYYRLASKVFSEIKTSLRHDLLRIPYTLLIMEMAK